MLNGRPYPEETVIRLVAKRSTWAGAVAAAGLLLTTQLAGSAAAASAPVAVRAVIWPNMVVTVAPAKFKHGTVSWVVKNRAATPQQLQVNGKETPIIEPGGSIKVTFTFKKRGYYSIALPDQQQSYQQEYRRLATRVKVT